MSHQSELIATDIEANLAEHQRKDLLRLLKDERLPDPEVEARLMEMYREWWVEQKREGSPPSWRD